jgi:release factor glutamine methyltransferase
MKHVDYQSQFSYKQALYSAIFRLKEANNRSPQLDSRLMLMSAAEKTLEDIIRNYDDIVDANILNKFNQMIESRLNGKPVAKIVGYKDFWKQRYIVNEFVLDPRPETELIVEYVTTIIHQNFQQNYKIADLGTGSGCIAISILAECFNSEALAIDINDNSLEVAKQNSELNNVAARLELKQNFWLDNISKKFDIIISNPPYIIDDEINNLSYEVKQFDPFTALSGGKDGLEAYRYIAKQIDHNSNPNCLFICEIGLNQHLEVKNIIENNSLFKLKEELKDYSNIIRTLVFYKDDINL